MTFFFFSFPVFRNYNIKARKFLNKLTLTYFQTITDSIIVIFIYIIVILSSLKTPSNEEKCKEKSNTYWQQFHNIIYYCVVFSVQNSPAEKLTNLLHDKILKYFEYEKKRKQNPNAWQEIKNQIVSNDWTKSNEWKIAHSCCKSNVFVVLKAKRSRTKVN